MSQRFLPEITLAEINALARSWIPESNRVVSVSAPERAGLALPTPARLAAVIADRPQDDADGLRRSRQRATAARHACRRPARSCAPRPATPLASPSGSCPTALRVILKPTPTRKTRFCSARSVPAGRRSRAIRIWSPAETAEQVVAAGGLGPFSTLDLNKVLAGSSTGVQADIDETEEGMRGGAARKDVEKMFQLIYLTFTAPRADPAQFEALKARLRPMLANQQARPEAAFRDALVSALTQDNPQGAAADGGLGRPDESRSIDGVLQEPIRRRQRFHVRVRRQLRRADHETAGRALPGQSAVDSSGRSRGRPRRAPAGRRRGTAGRQRRGSQSQVAIVFSGPFQNDQMHRLLIKTMSQMLGGNLQRNAARGSRRHLRRLGRAAVLEVSDRGVSDFDRFQLRPGAGRILTAAAWKVIQDFTQRGPSSDQLAGAQRARSRARNRLSGE